VICSDTLYLPDGNLLRTHTQRSIRYMEDDDPPVRAAVPGDAIGGIQWMLPMRRSSIRLNFFCTDEGLTLTDLKGTIAFLVKC